MNKNIIFALFGLLGTGAALVALFGPSASKLSSQRHVSTHLERKGDKSPEQKSGSPLAAADDNPAAPDPQQRQSVRPAQDRTATTKNTTSQSESATPSFESQPRGQTQGSVKQPTVSAFPAPAPVPSLSNSGTLSQPSSSVAIPDQVIVEEEIFLPAGESIPLVLGAAPNLKSPALAAAMDTIADNYLNNLENELAGSAQQSFAPASQGRGAPSAASRLANEEYRAIVGNQEADRVAVEMHLQNPPQ